VRGDPFFPAFIAGIELELAPIGQALVLSVVNSEEAELATYRKLVSDARVDGLFLTDLRHDDARVALCAVLGIPAVTLGHPEGSESPFPAVSMDDSAGIVDAVQHLIELGHRRIAHVAGPSRMLHGTRRRDAFTRAMQAAALDPSLVVEADFTAADGARATTHLLSGSERPTAIVYANDPMAIAGLGVAQRAGFRVPYDLSITGFDGTEIGEHLFPALSTVATDAVSWGRAATRVLLQAVAAASTDHQVAIDDLELPPATFVRRESTGPVPHQQFDGNRPSQR